MDERYEELAALNALGMLEGDEKRTLDGILIRDRELRALCAELEHAAAGLACLVTPVAPPAAMKNRIRARIRSRKGGTVTYRSAGAWGAIIGWAAAAAFAASSAWLWTEREKLSSRLQAATADAETAAQAAKSAFDAEKARLEQQLASLGTQLDTLKQRDALAQMQIATLQSSLDAYKQGVAVVVWDSEKQHGVLKLEKMPPVEAGKDYQLWVVDPKSPAPVDAGIVRVNADGFAKVDFKPVTTITEASKFALSVEKEGGVPKGEGPIVLIGP